MSKYVVATLQILSKDIDSLAKAIITCEVYIVNKLKANMLIGNDIIISKKIDILLLRKTLQISSYNIEVPMQVQV